MAETVEVLSLPTLESLQAHVHRVLCARDALDPAQTPLHQSPIRRGGRTCGLFFQVSGPRLVRNSAVWAGEENRILFYDSSGQRFAECRLTEGPDPLKVTARVAVTPPR
jgi:hypothetical protein